MIYYFCAACCLIFAKLYLRLSVYGVKNIPRRGGIVIASNHVSLLDPVIVGVACFFGSRAVYYMAKEELFKFGFFGHALRFLNAFPVKRNRGDISAVKGAINYLKDGKALLVFPEGSRKQNMESDGIKSGVGLLSHRADVSILPTFVSGSDRALPKGARFIRPFKVSVFFGKPYHPDRDMTYAQVSQQAMNRISRLKKASSKIYNKKNKF